MLTHEKNTIDLLRVAFIGNVDDGKSTLIGRLFHDSHAIPEDQYSELESSAKRRGESKVNLALFTDGLRAEREQGITIDVAYRYFASAQRKFIVVDCPGHFQYTRNMITGCSNVDAVVVLVDAKNHIAHGTNDQTKRHLAIAAMLGVRHFIVCVNKMDLVDYSESVFQSIRTAIEEATNSAGAGGLITIPISATDGDHVVETSSRMSWYRGPTLFEALDTLPIGIRDSAAAFRFPIQRVIRVDTPEHPEYRGYAGRIASGTVRVGDEITVAASGMRARVKGIQTYDLGEFTEARAPLSICLTLDREIDASRGDLLCGGAPPRSVSQVDVRICWLGTDPPDLAMAYTVQHNVRKSKAKIVGFSRHLDMKSLQPRNGDAVIAMNDIANARLRLSQPLSVDAYRTNHTTGSLILIDPRTHRTVAAGMILPEEA